MTQRTPQPADFQGVLSRLADSANAVDWWRWTLRAIGGIQFLYAAAIGCALLLGAQSSLGVLGFLQRDTGIPPSVVGILFVFGMGLATRGVFPRYESLLVIVGQVAYTLITLLYVFRGELPFSGLAGHGGTCLICAMLIVGATQRHNSPRHYTPVKNVLMPAMGTSLLLYAIGLVSRPDAAIASFIQGEYSGYLTLVLALWLAYGGGYMLFNHILAKWLFAAMMGQYLYTLLAFALLAAQPTTTSLAGVGSHFAFSVIATYIIFIQTDYTG